MNTLEIPDNIQIPISEIEITAIRSQGAGGQNINKVATAIHLRFDAFKCIAIPERIKERLRNSSDHRITYDGIIIIKSQAYRSQERNKQAALRRLKELLVGATYESKRRIKTKPSLKARQKRIDSKKHRSILKKNRKRITVE
ncbi:MAG: alternative ribosome rescue aminoacyl-tRNA hydrolase ArfB [Woeseiaceae bacterium]|nr:alternative ribosome rescue aminoacyl-tRNA hydrolase ArfB [Woeseiaceae bacterium]